MFSVEQTDSFWSSNLVNLDVFSIAFIILNEFGRFSKCLPCAFLFYEFISFATWIFREFFWLMCVHHCKIQILVP